MMDFFIVSWLDAERDQFYNTKMMLEKINTKLDQVEVVITALNSTYEQMVVCVNNLEG